MVSEVGSEEGGDRCTERTQGDSLFSERETVMGMVGLWYARRGSMCLQNFLLEVLISILPGAYLQETTHRPPLCPPSIFVAISRCIFVTLFGNIAAPGPNRIDSSWRL